LANKNNGIKTKPFTEVEDTTLVNDDNLEATRILEEFFWIGAKL